MAVSERFHDPRTHGLLEPYADRDGLVGGYRVERKLAQDGWRHTTYQAVMADGRPVALKLLDRHFGEDRRLARRFGRRLRLRASIEHPHLLPIIDWGRLGDRHYLVTPLCQAPTLANLLAAGPLEAGGALELLGQLADALETAHERGLVHRDLAPDQVFVDPDGGGRVLVGDFGVADPEWPSQWLDVTGSTPYLSPESLRDEPLSRESNVYSLACMLVECITGSPPYVSEHEGGVAYAHVAESPPRLVERCPDLPGSIDDVVAAGMAKDPAERLGSARHLVTAAAVCLGGRVPPALVAGAEARPAGGSRTPPPQTPRPAAAPRRPTIALALTLALTVACCGALGFALGRSGDDATGAAAGRPDRSEAEHAALLRAADNTLERLDARRGVSRRRLATARTRRAQAGAAARLLAGYQAAGDTLPNGAAGRILAPALEEAERGYRRLARAARVGDRRRYAEAAGAVRRSEERLDQAIARLNRERI